MQISSSLLLFFTCLVGLGAFVDGLISSDPRCSPFRPSYDTFVKSWREDVAGNPNRHISSSSHIDLSASPQFSPFLHPNTTKSAAINFQPNLLTSFFHRGTFDIAFRGFASADCVVGIVFSVLLVLSSWLWIGCGSSTVVNWDVFSINCNMQTTLHGRKHWKTINMLVLFMIFFSLDGCDSQAVYGTGYNYYGQLGLGDTTNRLTPAWIIQGGLSAVSIKAISAGWAFSLMLSNGGLVYGTGGNGEGELGLGDNSWRFVPTLMTAGGLSTVSITSISAGWGNSLLLSSAGKTYSTGLNGYGELGLGDTTNRWTPTLITAGGLSTVVVTAISSGCSHSLVVSSAGKVFSIGRNVYGRLGLGDTIDRWTPALITAGGLSTVVISAVSAGGWYTYASSTYSPSGHSLMISNAGAVYSAGYNTNGQLGLGDTTDRWTPTLITAGGLSTVVITAVSAGGWFQSLMLSNAGKVYAAGTGSEIGVGDATGRWTPTMVTAGGLSTVSIIAISAGGYHSLMLSSSGTAYSNGVNDEGQLGLGDSSQRFTPTMLSVQYTIGAISAGWESSLLLSETNECTSNTHNCNTNAACTNTVGSFTCSCNTGYNGNGVSCTVFDFSPKVAPYTIYTTITINTTMSCTSLTLTSGLASTTPTTVTTSTIPPTTSTATTTATTVTISTAQTVATVATAAATTTAATSVSNPAAATTTAATTLPYGALFTLTLSANAAALTIGVENVLYTVSALCGGQQFSFSSLLYSSPVSDRITLTMAMNIPTGSALDAFVASLKSSLVTLLSLSSTDQVVNVVLVAGSTLAQFYLAQASQSSPSPSTLVLNLKTAASNGNLKSVIPAAMSLSVAGTTVTVIDNNPTTTAFSIPSTTTATGPTTSTGTTVTSTSTAPMNTTTAIPSTTTTSATTTPVGSNAMGATTTTTSAAGLTTSQPETTIIGATDTPITPNVGGIVGGVIAAVVVLAAIIGVVYFKVIRRPSDLDHSHGKHIKPATHPPSKSEPAFFEIYRNTKAPTDLSEILPALKQAIVLYCGKVGVSTTAANAFYHALESEALQGHAANVDKMEFLGTYFWTSGKKLQEKPTEFCGILQYALREDDSGLLQHACVIIRAINELCVTRRSKNTVIPWPSNYTLYRGGGLPEIHRAFFTAEKKFRFRGYFATSADWNVARGFLQQSTQHPPVLWIINIDPNYQCVQVNYVGQVGAFGNKEAEFLFVPYSVFTVKNAYYNDQYHHYIIDIDAAVDNSQEPMDLDFAPWY